MIENKEVPLTVNIDEYLQLKKDLENSKAAAIKFYNMYVDTLNEFMNSSNSHNEEIKNLQSKISKIERKRWYWFISKK